MLLRLDALDYQHAFVETDETKWTVFTCCFPLKLGSILNPLTKKTRRFPGLLKGLKFQVCNLETLHAYFRRLHLLDSLWQDSIHFMLETGQPEASSSPSRINSLMRTSHSLVGNDTAATLSQEETHGPRHSFSEKS